MSDFSDLVDAMVTGIQAGVTGLDTTTVPASKVHKYAPWNPLELTPDGARHLAVWPLAEAEAGSPLAQNVHQIHTLQHSFAALAWEDAASSRGAPDPTGDAAWLTLANGLRDFFYTEANRQRSFSWGGYYRITHVGTAFPEQPQAVRWVALTVTADRTIAFT